MQDAAAIRAQLVDIRNIGMEKSVKLTLHVPAEQAPLVLEAFGWPTNVNPVPVAVARLNPDHAGEAVKSSTTMTSNSASASASRRGGPAPERRPFTSLPLPQQAALLCADPVFQAFVEEEFGWSCQTDDDAKRWMYDRYGIASRAQLGSNDKSSDAAFIRDREQFMAWKLVSA